MALEYRLVECDGLPLSRKKLNAFLAHHQSSLFPTASPCLFHFHPCNFPCTHRFTFFPSIPGPVMMCTTENTPSFKDKRRFKVPKSRKKHKFLSLRRQFPPPPLRQSFADSSQSHKPIDLMDNQEHENVAYFFSTADGGAADLTGLLDNASESNSSHATVDSCRHEDFSTYAYRIHDREERAALVRNALRSKKREESSEEKWVCYSEVVEGKVKEEEVSSSVVDLWRRPGEDPPVRLSLKLDYEDVVKAWSGRGPFYVVDDSAEATRIAPDITDDLSLSNNVKGVKGGEGSVEWWAVPAEEDMKSTTTINNSKETRTRRSQAMMMSVSVRLKMGGRREASLLRYKAKRQKRLFSKKIRYQVRKLNADKRPRLKGRFVKRG